MPADPEAAADPSAERRVVLLGPQRRPTVDQVARDLGVDGPLATVTAGWQEREPDDAELDELLGGRSANLCLYGRWLDIQERDPEYARAELAHRDLLDELRTLHLVQLESALTTLHALKNRTGDPAAAIDAAVGDAEAVVRLIDDRHAQRVREMHEEFAADFPTDERKAITEHQEAVRALLEQASALFLAGGHIGDLLRLLKLFRVGDLMPASVVAWSAGAMALTEKVVLFHDRTPQGRSPVEVFDEGLRVVRSVVLLPDARRRLFVDDASRMAELARRLAPAVCVTLDRGDQVELHAQADEKLPGNARIVGTDGRIAAQEAA